jgi:hypothetical protein
VIVEERRHDPGAELLAQVDGEVRQPHLMGERAGAAHGRGRAARPLGAVVAVGPQLQRHADGLPAPSAQQRGHGAVDSAAHGDEGALRCRIQPGVRPDRGTEGTVQGVGGQLGGVALGGTEAPELGGDRVRPYASGVEDALAAHKRDRGAAGG